MNDVLIKATFEHFESFYSMKCEPNNIKWSGFLEPPDRKQLKDWYKKQLDSANRTIYYLNSDDKIYAYCYLDKIDDNTIEIAYGVSEIFSGKGKGTELISQIIKKLRLLNAINVIAWVSEKNIGSSKILMKNGFIRTQQSEVRELPLIRNASIFYLWRKEL